jgi:hypothetical protein
MFDVAVYTTHRDDVDWRELADQVFPDDVLRQAPAVNRLVFTKVQIAPR